MANINSSGNECMGTRVLKKSPSPERIKRLLEKKQKKAKNKVKKCGKLPKRTENERH